jgi:predicted phosphodiesterase
MRLAIVSDIHANVEALSASLREISAAQVHRIICLGDIVGYNANPSECIALLREAAALCVAGNHDRAVAGQIETTWFSATAAKAVAWTRRRLTPDELDFLAGLPSQLSIENCLVAVHQALHPIEDCEMAGLDNEERRRLSFQALMHHPSRARICAFGHTHQAGVYELRHERLYTHDEPDVRLWDGATYLVNPGTVGQPRSADRRAMFMLLDTDSKAVSIRRVPYDGRAAFAKTRKAGLLPPLASMPAPLRSHLKWGARKLGLLKLRSDLQGRPRH